MQFLGLQCGFMSRHSENATTAPSLIHSVALLASKTDSRFGSRESGGMLVAGGGGWGGGAGACCGKQRIGGKGWWVGAHEELPVKGTVEPPPLPKHRPLGKTLREIRHRILVSYSSHANGSGCADQGLRRRWDRGVG